MALRFYDTACRTLRAAGHDLRCHDLYAENFNPVLSTEERRQYLTDTAAIIAKHPDHIDNLQWAEGLIVIYPTWYYGPPRCSRAGWSGSGCRGSPLKCRWQAKTDKAETAEHQASGRHHHLGQPVVVDPADPDPGRSLWTRGLRPLFSPRCRVIWKQLYNMNHVTEDERKTFLGKVERSLKSIPV